MFLLRKIADELRCRACERFWALRDLNEALYALRMATAGETSGAQKGTRP